MSDSAQTVEEKTEEQQQQQNDTAQQESKPQAQSAEFPEAPATGKTGAAKSLDILLDMSVPVTVAIGKTEIPIQRLLKLGPGSVLKLDKIIGEPVDLYLKEVKFATGDVVVVDDRFAIRIKQILGNDIPGSTDEA